MGSSQSPGFRPEIATDAKASPGFTRAFHIKEVVEGASTVGKFVSAGIALL
jgi:hypothetical protein